MIGLNVFMVGALVFAAMAAIENPNPRDDGQLADQIIILIEYGALIAMLAGLALMAWLL